MADAREEKLKNARLKLEQFRNQKKFKTVEIKYSVENISSEGQDNIIKQEDIIQSDEKKSKGVQVEEILNTTTANSQSTNEEITTTVDPNIAITKDVGNADMVKELDKNICHAPGDASKKGDENECVENNKNEESIDITVSTQLSKENLTDPFVEIDDVSKKENALNQSENSEEKRIILEDAFYEENTADHLKESLNDLINYVSLNEYETIEKDVDINSISESIRAECSTEYLNDVSENIVPEHVKVSNFHEEKLDDYFLLKMNTNSCEEELTKNMTKSLDDVNTEENVSGNNDSTIYNISGITSSCEEKMVENFTELLNSSKNDEIEKENCKDNNTDFIPEGLNTSLNGVPDKREVSNEDDQGRNTISDPVKSYTEILIGQDTEFEEDSSNDVYEKEHIYLENDMGEDAIVKPTSFIDDITDVMNQSSLDVSTDKQSSADGDTHNLSTLSYVPSETYSVASYSESHPPAYNRSDTYIVASSSERQASKHPAYVRSDTYTIASDEEIQVSTITETIIGNINNEQSKLAVKDTILVNDDITVEKVKEGTENSNPTNIIMESKEMYDSLDLFVKKIEPVESMHIELEIQNQVEDSLIYKATVDDKCLEMKQLEERNRELGLLLEKEQVSKEQLALELENKISQLDNLKEAMLEKMKEVYQTHFKEKSDLEKNIIDIKNEFTEQLDSLSTNIISLSSDKIEIEKNGLELKNTLTTKLEEDALKQTEKLRQKEEECGYLQNKIDIIERENVEVKNELDSLSTNIINLSSEKIEMEKNYVELKNSLTTQFENEALKQTEKLRQTSDECLHLQSEIEGSQKENVKIKNDLSTLNSQYISLLQETGTQHLLNEKDSEISNLRKMLNEMSIEKNNLIHERNQLAQQYSTYSKDLASHTEKLSEHLRRFQGENARLVQRERALVEHVATLETKLMSSTGGNSEQREEFSLLREKYVALENQMKVTTEENGALKKRIGEHIAEARKVKISNDSELQSLSHKLENKERRVLELEAHIKQVEISNCLNVEKLEKSLEGKIQQILILESQIKKQGNVAEKKELQLKDDEHEADQKEINYKMINKGEVEPDKKHPDEIQENLKRNKDQDKDEEICVEVENRLKIAMERVGQLTSEKAHLEELVSDLQDETEIIGDYITIYQNQRKQQKEKLEEKEEQMQQMEKEKQKLSASLIQMHQLLKKFVRKDEAGIDRKEEDGTSFSDDELLEIFSNNDVTSIQNKEHEFEPWLWQPAAGKVLTV